MDNPIRAYKSIKNTSENRVDVYDVLEDSRLLVAANDGMESLFIEETLSKGVVQFFFCISGSIRFIFHGGNYSIDLKAHRSFTFYNPERQLPMQLELAPGTHLAALELSVDELHRLFVKGEGELSFLSGERANQKYYREGEIGPNLQITLEQVHSARLTEATAPLYMRGKAFEILSLFFNREAEKKDNSCPFLEDEKNVERIRHAKKILLERMQDPPSLTDLAREVGLNEYRLKAGFKNIYGKSAYAYLNDHKLDLARKMLQESDQKVNEVAYQIGYTNPSHFIAAFKKRFGITPKKFLTSLQ